jgi:hypothetical protein
MKENGPDLNFHTLIYVNTLYNIQERSGNKQYMDIKVMLNEKLVLRTIYRTDFSLNIFY